MQKERKRRKEQKKQQKKKGTVFLNIYYGGYLWLFQ